MSLLSLLSTRPFLELTAKYHHRQRLDRLRSVSECLRIDQYTGSEEWGGVVGRGWASILQHRRRHAELAGLDPHPPPPPGPRRGGGGRRRLLRALLCAAQVPVMPLLTRHYAAPCRVCLLPSHNPSAAGAAAALGTSSTTTTASAGGGGGGEAHESEQSLLSFAGSELSRHLRHAVAKSAEAIEGLLTFLYNRVYGIVSRPDLARIFVALGRDAGGRGGGYE